MLQLKTKSVLLISCYELGHQPAGLSLPLGFLRREGIAAEAMDVSVEGFDAAKVLNAKFVGISVPMHTALRLGVSIAREVRKLNPDCHICFYGLYAALNSDYLLADVADSIIGGEFEAALTALIKQVLSGASATLPEGVTTQTQHAAPIRQRLNFAPADTTALPTLERYAHLEMNGEARLTGYVEATRGCLHNCTHCPIPPVYGGRFFVVPADVVMENIRRMVSAGAQHITFGDPDFLNAPTHSLRLVRRMHEEFPHLTFDCTIKVEHILEHEKLFAEFAECGCLFVVSAVESLSDEVLMRLEKGHSREDVNRALAILRDAEITLRPSLVSFTPWTTLNDFIDVLDWVECEGLIDAVEPVQYSIRLLVPPGSLLLERADSCQWFGDLRQESFSYEWQHPDPRMDALQQQVARLVEQAAQQGEDALQTFYRIRSLAYRMRGDESVEAIAPFIAARLKPPRLTEAWFC